jgi:hypothetical protein
MKVLELKKLLDEFDDDLDVIVDAQHLCDEDEVALYCIEKVYEGSCWNIIIKIN